MRFVPCSFWTLLIQFSDLGRTLYRLSSCTWLLTLPVFRYFHFRFVRYLFFSFLSHLFSNSFLSLRRLPIHLFLCWNRDLPSQDIPHH
ncbi:hypothetical protein K438DRAFT_1821932 [Mycena galopus ATCC 62051]|nr:hypothetical protein K438DRAFT_1821932 [Mycena galopus ATCC 62051]